MVATDPQPNTIPPRPCETPLAVNPLALGPQTERFASVAMVVFVVSLIGISDTSRVSAQDVATADQSPMFEMQDLFESVRIPNITVTTRGTVLAFAKSGKLLRRSEDGGKTWSPVQEVGEPFYFKYGTKPSYGCNAGLVRMPLEATGGKDVLLFSTPDNPGKTRFRMTVWASFDQGKTWPVKRLVFAGPSAYSSLAAGPDGTIYLLYERGDKKLYEKIAVARFNLAWLTESGS